MKIMHLDKKQPKGWFTGPWDSNLPIAIGFANQAIDEPHDHRQVTEIYMVARGSVTLRVESQSLQLSAGDVVILEPGEARTFIDASKDYFIFIIHTPGLNLEQMRADKITVSRERLGLH